MRVNFDDIDSDYSLRYTHNGEPFTGEIIETDPDGNVTGLITVLNGWPHGPDRDWYPDGRLRSASTAINNRVVGTYREWHHNGVLAEERDFSDEGDLLVIRRWDEHGTLMPPDSYRSTDPATRYDRSPRHNPPDMTHTAHLPPLSRTENYQPAARELETPQPEAEENP